MKRLTCLVLSALAAGCYASFAEPGDDAADLPAVELPPPSAEDEKPEI